MIEPEIKADLTKSSNKILKELALPAATQLGQAFENIFGILNTATLPAKLANNYAKRNFDKLNQKK